MAYASRENKIIKFYFYIIYYNSVWQVLFKECRVSTQTQAFSESSSLICFVANVKSTEYCTKDPNFLIGMCRCLIFSWTSPRLTQITGFRQLKQKVSILLKTLLDSGHLNVKKTSYLGHANTESDHWNPLRIYRSDKKEGL